VPTNSIESNATSPQVDTMTVPPEKKSSLSAAKDESSSRNPRSSVKSTVLTCSSYAACSSGHARWS